MIEYKQVVDDEVRHYSLSYSQLKEEYILLCEATDEQFLSAIPKVLHLSCIICYLKEVPAYCVLGDTGLIHELAHALEFKDQVNIRALRRSFETVCKLV